MLKAGFFDTETSGLTPPVGVCECAYIEFNVDDLKEVDRQHSLIDPEVHITPSASGIHRITDDMVTEMPTLKEWFDVVLKRPFHGHKLLFVAHNAPFDLPLMQPAMGADEIIVLCTLKLARHVYPDAENHKLATLKYMFGLGEKGSVSHGAMADVADGMDLLRKIIADTNMSLNDLIDLQDKPRMLKVMPFGKHKGMPVAEVPKSYISWFMKQPETPEQPKDKDLIYTFQQLGLA